MPEALLILILSLNFEPIQRSGEARQKFTMECPCRDLWSWDQIL